MTEKPTKEQLKKAIELLRGKEQIHKAYLISKRTGKIKGSCYVVETDCGTWDMFGDDKTMTESCRLITEEQYQEYQNMSKEIDRLTELLTKTNDKWLRSIKQYKKLLERYEEAMTWLAFVHQEQGFDTQEQVNELEEFFIKCNWKNW